LISSGNLISITTLFSNIFNFSTESVRGRFLARLFSLKVAFVDDES